MLTVLPETSLGCAIQPHLHWHDRGGESKSAHGSQDSMPEGRDAVAVTGRQSEEHN